MQQPPARLFPHFKFRHPFLVEHKIAVIAFLATSNIVVHDNQDEFVELLIFF
jgi:hypothetical protein